MLKVFPLLLLVLLASLTPGRSDNSKAPNVILILADDMGVGDLSALNDGRTRTPHLDRLMRESVWFSQAYSASPVCAPARAALLTGRYPHRTGVVTLNMERYPVMTRIRAEEVTMADLFQEAGYRTGLIGKWHSGLGEEFHPLQRGFDEFQGFLGHLYVPSYFDYKLDIQDVPTEIDGRYLTSDLSQRAIDFVERHHETPFFLHLAHYAPHRPIEAPEELVRPYVEEGFPEDVAAIYAMNEVMDTGIGDLLKKLDELGIRENTILIFASDNGPDGLATEEPRFNLNLRGTKYEVHEGGIRVPFLVHAPGRFQPAETDAPIHFTDVLPTLMELCDLEGPENALDGVSFAPLLRGESADLPEQRFWQWNRAHPRYTHNAAIREGKWKLVRPFVTKNHPKGPSELPAQLFNLEDDPAETTDLAAEFPERAKRMEKALRAWCEDVEASRTREPADPS